MPPHKPEKEAYRIATARLMCYTPGVMRGFAAALGLLACGGEPRPADETPESYPIDGPDAAFSCAPEWCPAVEWAVNRWNRATGWNARVSDDGIPVVFSSDPDEPAWGQCGLTDVLVQDGDVIGGIRVTVMLDAPRACADLHRTLTHELGHILCARGGGPGGKGDECHRGTCVMGKYSDLGACHVIDDDSLDVVCERWGCPARAREAKRFGSVVYPARPAEY